jgi:hypothetical protein
MTKYMPIRIDNGLKAKLDKIKENPEETYDHLIKRLVAFHKKIRRKNCKSTTIKNP